MSNCILKGFIAQMVSSTIWSGLSIHAARKTVLIYLRHTTIPQRNKYGAKTRKIAETHSTDEILFADPPKIE